MLAPPFQINSLPYHWPIETFSGPKHLRIANMQPQWIESGSFPQSSSLVPGCLPTGYPLQTRLAPQNAWEAGSHPGESATARANREASLQIDMQFGSQPRPFGLTSDYHCATNSTSGGVNYQNASHPIGRSPSTSFHVPAAYPSNPISPPLTHTLQPSRDTSIQLNPRTRCPPHCTCPASRASVDVHYTTTPPQSALPTPANPHAHNAPDVSLNASTTSLVTPRSPQIPFKPPRRRAPKGCAKGNPVNDPPEPDPQAPPPSKRSKTTTNPKTKSTSASKSKSTAIANSKSTATSKSKSTSTSETQSTHVPFDEDHNTEELVDESAEPKRRTPLSPQVVAAFANDPLDKLRARAADHGEYIRLSIEDKIELDAAHLAYQRSVAIITIKNKLKPGPVQTYLGNATRSRGTTNFNYFCKYDEEAGPIHRDPLIPYSERMVACGALWFQLGDAGRRQWKDEEFLDSIAAKRIDDAEAEPVPQSYRRPDRLKLTAWTRKIKRELHQLSHSHQVKGYVVLASRDPNRRSLIAGGSHMAEQFLDMKSERTDERHMFFRYVNGQQAVKDMTGKYPAPTQKKRPRGKDGSGEECPFDLGDRDANRKAVRVKLKAALSKATHGLVAGGWPGTNTASKLRNAGVTLQIQGNDQFVTAQDFCGRPSDMDLPRTQRILTAFGKESLLPPDPASRKRNSRQRPVKALPKAGVAKGVVGVIRRERSHTPSEGGSPLPTSEQLGDQGSKETSAAPLPSNHQETDRNRCYPRFSDGPPSPPARPQRTCTIASAQTTSVDEDASNLNPPRHDKEGSYETDESYESDDLRPDPDYTRIDISDDDNSDDDD
ncbi:hypothetical protein Pst134EA_007640 [Puccinia striiformis f. sp. tritici]|nr:hypothetical protein Pst134EA_007640 [Puccinia striiformis f. sp. tritici]KAH9470378.1 hypothetical protein Pst134EA_007640 [Puccinia striiformis f. sp. tritici]